MADERIVQTLLKYRVDPASLSAVEGSTKTVKSALASIGREKAFDQLAASAARFVAEGREVEDVVGDLTDILTAYGAKDSDIDRVTKAFERNRAAIQSASQAAEDANRRAAERLSARSTGPANNEHLGDVSTGLGAAASVIGAGGANAASETLRLGGDVTGFLEYVPRLQVGFKNLRGELGAMVSSIGAGNIAAVGAIAALTAVILLLRNEAAKTGEDAKIAIQASQDYNRLVLTGTTESLTAQRQAAEQELKIAQQNFEQAQTLKTGLEEGIRAAFGDARLAIAQVNASLGTNNQELAKVNENYDTANKALQEAQAAVGVYDRALQSNEVAANDAALAIQRQVEATQKLSTSLNDIQLGVLKEATTLTSDQLQQRLEGLNNERKALETLIASGTVTGEQLAQYNEQLQKNGTETAYLLTLAAPLVEARERESAAIQEQLDAITKDIDQRIRLNDLLKNTSFDDIQKRAEALQAERAAIEASLPELEALASQSQAGADAYQNAQNRLKSLNSEMGLLSAAAPTAAMRELNGLLSDLDGELAKVRSTYDESVRNANTKFQSGLKQLEAELGKQQDKDRAEARKAIEQFEYEERVRKREHRQKLKEIDAQFDTDRQKAIGDRDAVALQAAEETRDKEKAAENQRFQEENDARAREYKLLQDSIRVQQQATLENFNQRRDALIAQNQQEVQAAYAKYQAEFAARQQAYAAQTQQLQQFLQNEARLRQQAFSAAISVAGQALGGLNKFIGQAFNAVKSIFSGLGAGKSLLSGLGIRIPSFDTEGRVTKTGLAIVDEGEVITKESRQSNSFTFAPAIYGSDRNQIRQQVIDQLDVVLDRIGAV